MGEFGRPRRLGALLRRRVVVEFQLSKSEFGRAHRQIAYRAIVRSTWAAFAVNVCVIAYALADSSRRAVWLVLGITVLGLLLLRVFYEMFIRPGIAWDKHPNSQGPRRQEFSEEGVLLQTLSASHMLAWASVEEVHETRDFYFLRQRGSRSFGIGVPRRAFATGDDQTVFRWLATAHAQTSFRRWAHHAETEQVPPTGNPPHGTGPWLDSEGTWRPPVQPTGFQLPPPSYLGPPSYRPAQRTSGLAIASFVLSLVWILGFGSLLAVILGLVARNNIKRSGGLQTGKGLATAGTIIGIIGLLGSTMIVVSLRILSTHLVPSADPAQVLALGTAANVSEGRTTDRSVTVYSVVYPLDLGGRLDPRRGKEYAAARVRYCAGPSGSQGGPDWLAFGLLFPGGPSVFPGQLAGSKKPDLTQVHQVGADQCVTGYITFERNRGECSTRPTRLTSSNGGYPRVHPDFGPVGRHSTPTGPKRLTEGVEPTLSGDGAGVRVAIV